MDGKPNLVMYLFANKGLGMSPGKMAAQVAHAAVRAYEQSNSGARAEWLATGETKIVLEARDEMHLRNIIDYLAEHQTMCVPIIDEGRTETPPLSITAAGVPILDKDDPSVKFLFSSFKLYKESPTPQEREQLLRKMFGRYGRPNHRVV